jgi:hypothetical protein
MPHSCRVCDGSGSGQSCAAGLVRASRGMVHSKAVWHDTSTHAALCAFASRAAGGHGAHRGRRVPRAGAAGRHARAAHPDGRRRRRQRQVDRAARSCRGGARGSSSKRCVWLVWGKRCDAACRSPPPPTHTHGPGKASATQFGVVLSTQARPPTVQRCWRGLAGSSMRGSSSKERRSRSRWRLVLKSNALLFDRCGGRGSRCRLHWMQPW